MLGAHSIAVVGPHGNASRALIQTDTGKICPSGGFDCVRTPFEAIRALNLNADASAGAVAGAYATLPGRARARGTTTYTRGCSLFDSEEAGIEEAVAAARAADVVVLAVGITSCGSWWHAPDEPPDFGPCRVNLTDGSRFMEAEGHDRELLTLPPQQQELAARVLALGKPTVVLLLHGGQLAIDLFVGAPHVTIVDAFYPGAMGADALANLLFGRSNRWGKMPYTVYSADWTDNHHMLEHDVSREGGRTYRYMQPSDPQLVVPFGHGLSLSTFALKLSSSMGGAAAGYVIKTDGSTPTLAIEVEVTNTGAYTGDEVAQAYVLPVSVPGLSLHPVKSLFAFQRVHDMDPGKTSTVTFNVSIGDLLMVTEAGDRASEPGKYDLSFENGAGSVVVVHVTLEGDRNVVEAFPTVPTPLA